MRIEGETVVFKKDINMYDNERKGDKLYTIRILTNKEYVSLYSVTIKKIRIVEVFAQREAFFERDIQSIFRLGELFGHNLVGIAWIHKEEKEIPEQ